MSIENTNRNRYNEEKTKGGVLLKVLVACEESQEVCKAFRNYFGVNAFSCDIVPCSGGRPEWHIQEDVTRLINGNCSFRTMTGQEYVLVGKWDLIIAFPPCTHLAVSGARHFAKKREDGRQQSGIDFFMKMVNADCEHIAVENPIGIMSTHYRKPDQIIQPWQFGHAVTKSTCLWLKGLKPLVPAITEKPHIEYFEWIDKKTGKKKRQAKWYADAWRLSADERAKVRSKTFPGVAQAMAAQWVPYLRKEGI